MAYQHAFKDLENVLQHMQKNGRLCDMTLVAQGQQYHAHKVILAARSPYFAALFESNSRRQFNFDDISQQHIDILLRYSYGDFMISEENVFDALFVAIKFDMLYLREDCEQLLSRHITTENFVHFTNEAWNFGSTELQDKCVTYFGQYTRQIIERQKTDQLQREAMEQLLQSKTITGRETDLLKIMWSWGRAGLQKESYLPVASTEQVAEFLGSLVEHIQFLEMPVGDFVNWVCGKSLLPKSMEIVFHQYLAQEGARSVLFKNAHTKIKRVYGRSYFGSKIVAEQNIFPLDRQLKAMLCAECEKTIDTSTGQEWVKCSRCPDQHMCLSCAVAGQHDQHRQHMQVFINEGHEFWCSMCGRDLRKTCYGCLECPDFKICRSCQEKFEKCISCDEDVVSVGLLGTVRYNVKKIRELTEGNHYGPGVLIKGLLWEILVEKTTENGNPVLGYYLVCTAPADTSISCKATVDMKILSHKSGQQAFVKMWQTVFKAGEMNWGQSNFISWKDLVDPAKGYCKDDTVTFEVHIVAEQPEFL